MAPVPRVVVKRGTESGTERGTESGMERISRMFYPGCEKLSCDLLTRVRITSFCREFHGESNDI